MARHLLARGTIHKDDPIYISAGFGHADVVGALLDWGAKDRSCTMSYAAMNGHLEIVELLLSHHRNSAGAVTAAAERGRGDIVRVLLEHGATTQEHHGIICAVGHAILTEYTAMFQCHMEHGVTLPTGVSREACVRAARENGVESMLALLGTEELCVESTSTRD
jgi:ankyrin repeat protein